jgi:protein TonB
MASSMATDRHIHVDTLFAGALLASLALHTFVLVAMPGWEIKPNKISELLTVELQHSSPPMPLPPTEPPKPAPEKPRETPKKLLSTPKPILAPQPLPRMETPLPEPVRPVEPTPQVIAAAPKLGEPPPTFVAPVPLPEPPKPKIPTDQDVDAAKGNYGSLLSREFAKHKQYPRIAQMRGWQGTTKVELHIDAVGNITSSSVSETSGFEVLDKQALEMVRKASPLPLPPETLRGREFAIIVPVVFRLE